MLATMIGSHGLSPFLWVMAIYAVVLTVGFGALMFWGILRKSGAKPWHALIPVLQWTEAAKAAGRHPRWGLGPGVFPIAMPALFALFFLMTPNDPRVGLVFWIMALLWTIEIFAIIGHIYIAIGIRRTFATSDGMLVAMILVPIVGYAVVGLGSATHRTVAEGDSDVQ